MKILEKVTYIYYLLYNFAINYVFIFEGSISQFDQIRRQILQKPLVLFDLAKFDPLNRIHLQHLLDQVLQIGWKVSIHRILSTFDQPEQDGELSVVKG